MHKNNFDFLRLLFATLVLITHSYTLSGVPENDFLTQWTHGQINCSSLGVKGFFIISGFLIFQSVIRSRNWFDYMVRRILRIYPAYIVVMIVAVILCWWLTDLSTQQYFADPSVRSYVFQNLAMFLPLHYQIDNVFAHNPYPFAINGSIWTIPYEFLFYIILSAAFIIKRHTKLLTAAAIVLYVGLFLITLRYEDVAPYYIPKDTFEIHMLLHQALCFFGGAALAAISIHQFRYKSLLLLVAIVACGIVIATHQFYFAQFLLLPVIIIIIGTYATKGIAGLNKKIGDFSYGIYLYGFIVQQTLVHFYKMDHMQLMLTAIPLTYIVGALSWYLIEKRALTLKKYFP